MESPKRDSDPDIRVWKPLDVLYDSSCYSRNALLLLNVSLRKNIRHLHRMWNHSPVRFVLDGAGMIFYSQRWSVFAQRPSTLSPLHLPMSSTLHFLPLFSESSVWKLVDAVRGRAGSASRYLRWFRLGASRDPEPFRFSQRQRDSHAGSGRNRPHERWIGYLLV